MLSGILPSQLSTARAPLTTWRLTEALPDAAISPFLCRHTGQVSRADGTGGRPCPDEAPGQAPAGQLPVLVGDPWSHLSSLPHGPLPPRAPVPLPPSLCASLPVRNHGINPIACRGLQDESRGEMVLEADLVLWTGGQVPLTSATQETFRPRPSFGWMPPSLPLTSSLSGLQAIDADALHLPAVP